jgi:hypothetical protein
MLTCLEKTRHFEMCLRGFDFGSGKKALDLDPLSRAHLVVSPMGKRFEGKAMQCKGKNKSKAGSNGYLSHGS